MNERYLSFVWHIGGDLEEVHGATRKHIGREKLRFTAITSPCTGQRDDGLAADERRFAVVSGGLSGGLHE
jgi:hypothetical protein